MKLSRLVALASVLATLAVPAFGFGPGMDPYGFGPTSDPYGVATAIPIR